MEEKINITGSGKIYWRLSILMFLQFFVWGAWFTTLDIILKANHLDAITAGAYGTAPFAAIVAPLFLGLIADRFFASQHVMGVLFLLGGGLMFAARILGQDPSSDRWVLWLLTGHMLCYMPTLGLSNTIAFTHLERLLFPRVRVWGTIGWIVAGLLGGFLGWSTSLNLFSVSAVASLALGVFCFFLPHTPPPARGEAISWRSLLMLDAFKLILRPSFFVFLLCSFLICIPLAYYYAKTPALLLNLGFEQPASTMPLGQMSEIVFMLLVPFFFRRLGAKWMILIGMWAWVLRYVLFAVGASQQLVSLIYLGIILHGVCYDFFFVTGFMYTERVAPPAIRGQAQSLLVFVTQGLGMFIGYKIAFGVWTLPGQTVPVVTTSDQLQEAINGMRPPVELAYHEKMLKMFSIDLPEAVRESQLFADTLDLWYGYWMFPAIMAGCISLLFFATFWDASSESNDAFPSEIPSAD